MVGIAGEGKIVRREASLENDKVSERQIEFRLKYVKRKD